MRINLFEASRRIAIVASVVAVAVTAFSIMPDKVVKLTFSLSRPNANWEMSQDKNCDNEAGRGISSLTLNNGIKAFVTLCFNPVMLNDGSFFIETDIVENGAVIFDKSWSPQVFKYIQRASERFAIPDHQYEKVIEATKDQAINKAKNYLFVLFCFLVGLWTTFFAIGWIVRGLFGIPFGKDSRQPPESV